MAKTLDYDSAALIMVQAVRLAENVNVPGELPHHLETLRGWWEQVTTTED